MLEIKVRTGNAAFHDPCGDTEYDEEFKRSECTRILMGIIDKLDKGYDEGNILDINGNTVGNWSLS